MKYGIRGFNSDDAAAVNAVALAAFAEYRCAYSDWDAFSLGLGNMAALAVSGELIVALSAGRIVGAVAYIGPGKPKGDFFKIDWPIMRMLVVEPGFRGKGIGRALTEECARRATRDGSPVIALHTTPIMKVALRMYLRMGFQLISEAPPVFGVPYGIYLRRLNEKTNLEEEAAG